MGCYGCILLTTTLHTYSTGGPQQQWNQIMQTYSLQPNTTVGLIYPCSSLFKCAIPPPAYNTNLCGTPVCKWSLYLHVLCVPNTVFVVGSFKVLKFRYSLCFSVLKPRFILLFWGLTFSFCLLVILEMAPMADLLIHKGQRFDLLTSCCACLLFVLMFFPLLMVLHNW